MSKPLSGLRPLCSMNSILLKMLPQPRWQFSFLVSTPCSFSLLWIVYTLAFLPLAPSILLRERSSLPLGLLNVPRRLSDLYSHTHLPAKLQIHVYLQIRHQVQGSLGQSTPHNKNWTQHFTQTCYSSSISTLMNTTTISTRIQKPKSHPRLSSLRRQPIIGQVIFSATTNTSKSPPSFLPTSTSASCHLFFIGQLQWPVCRYLTTTRELKEPSQLPPVGVKLPYHSPLTWTHIVLFPRN